MKSCKIQSCAKPHVALGYCRNHWYRHHTHGNAFAGGTSRGEPRRFMAAIKAKGRGCVKWPFSKNNEGYAQINFPGNKKHLVSRLMCKKFHGEPPSPTHVAAHSCGKGHEACIAPWHLSWKTAKANTAEMMYRHRTVSCGSKHPNAILSEKDVRRIRALAGKKSQQKIGDQYGVSQTMVSKIHRGVVWRFCQ